jgi:MFS transporter, putative metabolite:H+ symporter
MVNTAGRIERLPLCGFHRRFITLISLGGWFDFYDIFMMAYIGAALQHSHFLTLREFSYVIAAGFVGMFIGTVVFGVGSDWFGRRTAFMWMLIVYSLFTFLGAFAPDASSLIVLRGLAGIGIGAELVVIDTYVTEMLPSRARALCRHHPTRRVYRHSDRGLARYAARAHPLAPGGLAVGHGAW